MPETPTAQEQKSESRSKSDSDVTEYKAPGLQREDHSSSPVGISQFPTWHHDGGIWAPLSPKTWSGLYYFGGFLQRLHAASASRRSSQCPLVRSSSAVGNRQSHQACHAAVWGFVLEALLQEPYEAITLAVVVVAVLVVLVVLVLPVALRS